MKLKELAKRSAIVNYAKLFYYMYRQEYIQERYTGRKRRRNGRAGTSGKFFAPRAVTDFLFRHWVEIGLILAKKRFVILQVEIALTARCSLRCRDCMNLMQYYHKPKDIGLEKNIKAIERICDAADYIMYFHVLGGEPFLYKELAEVLKYMETRAEIGEIVIFTNGTVMPAADVVPVLKNRKICVVISSYGELSKKADDLKKLLSDNHVKYIMYGEEFFWESYGDMSCRGRGHKELKKQFAQCSTLCRSVYNGRLHYCPRSGHASDLGVVTPKPGDYINLLNPSESIDHLRKRLMRFFYHKKDYISACNYCNKGTPYACKVRPGIQMKREEHTM